jgi:hypothetical protein
MYGEFSKNVSKFIIRGLMNGPETGICLNWIMPITTITIIASITAPGRPNKNHPARNAITENNPGIPPLTDTATFIISFIMDNEVDPHI